MKIKITKAIEKIITIYSDYDNSTFKTQELKFICRMAIIEKLSQELSKQCFGVKEIIDSSKSEYTVTYTECHIKFAEMILEKWNSTQIKHIRAKVANSYKYKPTSQCVSINVIKWTKSYIEYDFKQLASS